MKLTYRGATYDYNPPVVKAQDTPESGKYRGVDIRFRNPAKNAVHQPTLDLIYRGVAYQTGKASEQPAAAAAATQPVAVATPAIADKARLAMMNRHGVVKRRQQAMLGRLAAEVGLPETASRYWNHIQGKVHPSFWATYERSHATMS
ncbi:DUF4278 domain-containing protein [Almyronema epifaneia]|uniref:DUF4278 domain-containing protein n=1 Tax=Almyronema epifaneia S1 TaxID=2991925 RepID=A0ABW6IIV5_9CYAN